MARIPQETIDQIRDTADILDVVSDYIDLKRRGRNFFGLCPFHTEKTPSFSVAPDKQIFHCFGCGKGGNIFSFIMEYEKIEFVEAVRQLGKRYGIEIKLEQFDQSNKLYTQLYEIHEMATEFFKSILHSNDGVKALDYLTKRGFSEEIINKFRLGFTGNAWDTLLKKARKANFPDEVIDKSGLFVKNNKGRFDRFRNRILFPIINLSGRTVAFGGRDFSGTIETGQDPASREDHQAKYLNSPETPIYNKSEILFGLEATRDDIRKHRSAIVLEGYTDFLQLFQQGITNIVATSGTAFTDGHVNLIRRFADITYIAFDGDDAGRKAAIRAGYTLTRGGVSPTIVELPDDTDPDSWLRLKGREAFEKACHEGHGVLSFHLKYGGYNLDNPSEKSKLAHDIAIELKEIRDPIVQQYSIRQAANLLEVDDRIIINLIKRRPLRKLSSDKETPVKPTNFSTPDEKAQLELVKLLALGDHHILNPLKVHISTDRFGHPVLHKLADHLIRDKEGKFSQILEKFEKSDQRDLASKILFDAESHTTSFQAAVDCIITLEKAPLKEQISQHRIKLRELEQQGKDASEVLTKVLSLQSQLNDLNNRRRELLELEP